MATTSEQQDKLLSNVPDDRKGKKKSFGSRLAKNLASGPFAGSILGAVLGSFKRGGRVKRNGVYRLHKGERVVSARSSSRR